MSKSPNPRRIRQHRRLVQQLIQANGGVNSIFQKFDNRPSLEQALSMFEFGKFGGDEPLTKGGVEYALEYAFDEFNEVFNIIQKQPSWQNQTDSPFDFYVFNRAQDEVWANLLFTIFVDKEFAPFVSRLTRSEFVQFTENEEELIHADTRSIVFDLKFIGQIKKTDEFLSQQEKFQFSSTEIKGEAVYHYGIWIASPDLYLKQEESDRDIHSVREHTRKLSSGKRVSVKSHNRRNRLIEAGVPWDDYDDYIVYSAYDHDGHLRYIGEGRPNRYHHVNSGISHNYKLNEHHFTKGEMKVEILAKELSKPKALAIEKFLIGRNSPIGLWNIRDNPESKKT
jgi:hypothetical protein